MAKKDFISAIDIGTTKIVAMIARKTEDGRFEILGVGNAPSSGVKRGMVVHIDETASAISLAKQQAEEQAGCCGGTFRIKPSCFQFYAFRRRVRRRNQRGAR